MTLKLDTENKFSDVLAQKNDTVDRGVNYQRVCKWVRNANTRTNELEIRE